MPVAKTSTLRRHHTFIPNYPKSGAIQPGSILLGQAIIADGTGAGIVEPDMIPLVVSTVAGSGIALNGGNIEVLESGSYVIEIRSSVLHNWGSDVILYYSVDNAPAVEFGRVTVQSNDLTLAIARRDVTLTAGQVYSFLISSNFAYSDFEWVGTEILLAKGA